MFGAAQGVRKWTDADRPANRAVAFEVKNQMRLQGYMPLATRMHPSYVERGSLPQHFQGLRPKPLDANKVGGEESESDWLHPISNSDH